MVNQDTSQTPSVDIASEPVTLDQPVVTSPAPALVPTDAPGANINAFKEEARLAIGSVQAELNKAVEAVEHLIERIVPGTPHEPTEPQA